MAVQRSSALARAVVILLAVVVLCPLLRLPACAVITQKNLVSDIPGLALRTDPDLVNPWGIVFTPTGELVVPDNGTGLVTFYNPQTGSASPTIVNVPVPLGAGGTAAPTGAVYNATGDFMITNNGLSRPARLIFATEDGTISAWNFSVLAEAAILTVDNSPSSAVYKGLAMVSNSSGNFLAAANFRAGTVDVFDTNFTQVSLAGTFSDPTIPAGFAPFGIANIDGMIFVTYAMQDALKHDDVAGLGNGFVNVFNADGQFISRVASNGKLNSPWGMAVRSEPPNRTGRTLLVGNFGDGHINRISLDSFAFLGQVGKAPNKPVVLEGLWGLAFGSGLEAEEDSLYFAAGTNHEADGLMGFLTGVSQLRFEDSHSSNGGGIHVWQ